MQRSRPVVWLVPLAFVAACAGGGGSNAPDPEPGGGGSRLVQPGAPGEATRSIDSSDLDELGGVAWTEADVHFMQKMIPHHAQALEMTALVDQHATTVAVQRMSLRMKISQRDEIALMERWLRERDQDVPQWQGAMTAGGMTGASMAGMAGMDGMGSMAMMPGMLTPDQMQRLRTARGPDFDRLFLEYMIQHHEGAIVMVRDLFTARGGGQESEIFQFASHVDADQTAEIERMQGILDTLR